MFFLYGFVLGFVFRLVDRAADAILALQGSVKKSVCRLKYGFTNQHGRNIHSIEAEWDLLVEIDAWDSFFQRPECEHGIAPKERNSGAMLACAVLIPLLLAAPLATMPMHAMLNFHVPKQASARSEENE